MGPRSHERGNSEYMRFSACVGRLQWGRVLMNAETFDSTTVPAGDSTASMGPRSHERGNRRAPHPHRSPIQASMGPRSHERGNGLGRATDKAEKALLQWGRVLMNAETEKPPGHDVAWEGFNGAAFS